MQQSLKTPLAERIRIEEAPDSLIALILMDTLQDDLQAVGRRIAERVRDWSEGELSFLIALPHRNGDRSAFQVIVTRGGLDRPTFVMTAFDVQALGKRLENEFVELLYPDPKPKF